MGRLEGQGCWASGARPRPAQEASSSSPIPLGSPAGVAGGGFGGGWRGGEDLGVARRRRGSGSSGSSGPWRSARVQERWQRAGWLGPVQARRGLAMGLEGCGGGGAAGGDVAASGWWMAAAGGGAANRSVPSGGDVVAGGKTEGSGGADNWAARKLRRRMAAAQNGKGRCLNRKRG
nr:heterogeneous nuclear ribonucleoprotein A1-like [Aegilops tauschii subsp. strangulata]